MRPICTKIVLDMHGRDDSQKVKGGSTPATTAYLDVVFKP